MLSWPCFTSKVSKWFARSFGSGCPSWPLVGHGRGGTPARVQKHVVADGLGGLAVGRALVGKVPHGLASRLGRSRAGESPSFTGAVGEGTVRPGLKLEHGADAGLQALDVQVIIVVANGLGDRGLIHRHVGIGENV